MKDEDVRKKGKKEKRGKNATYTGKDALKTHLLGSKLWPFVCKLEAL